MDFKYTSHARIRNTTRTKYYIVFRTRARCHAYNFVLFDLQGLLTDMKLAYFENLIDVTKLKTYSSVYFCGKTITITWQIS